MMYPKMVRVEKICDYVGGGEICREEATTIIFDRESGLASQHPEFSVKTVCDRHADMIIRETEPEYEVNCPKCGCVIPVG